MHDATPMIFLQQNVQSCLVSVNGVLRPARPGIFHALTMSTGAVSPCWQVAA